MKNLLIILFCSSFIFSCQELITFELDSEEDYVTINGYISNLPHSELVGTISDGRYFTIEVSYSRKVGSFQNQVITEAQVTIESSEGMTYQLFQPDPNEGIYMILIDEFKVCEGESFRVVVYTPFDTFYSEWESLPESKNKLDDLSYKLEEEQLYIFRKGEREIRDAVMVNVSTTLPDTEGEELYYVWTFESAWKFVSYIASAGSPFKTCYIIDDDYVPDFTLRKHDGPEDQQFLFGVELDNHRMKRQFMTRITQRSVSRGYYEYIEGIKEQTQRGTIFDSPPFNLPTNIYSENGTKVAGYFGVVNELQKNWFINQEDIGYFNDTYDNQCSGNLPPPFPPRCYNCLRYGNSTPQTNQPDWWIEAN